MHLAEFTLLPHERLAFDFDPTYAARPLEYDPAWLRSLLGGGATTLTTTPPRSQLQPGNGVGGATRTTAPRTPKLLWLVHADPIAHAAREWASMTRGDSRGGGSRDECARAFAAALAARRWQRAQRRASSSSGAPGAPLSLAAAAAEVDRVLAAVPRPCGAWIARGGACPAWSVTRWLAVPHGPSASPPFSSANALAPPQFSSSAENSSLAAASAASTTFAAFAREDVFFVRAVDLARPAARQAILDEIALFAGLPPHRYDARALMRAHNVRPKKKAGPPAAAGGEEEEEKRALDGALARFVADACVAPLERFLGGRALTTPAD